MAPAASMPPAVVPWPMAAPATAKTIKGILEKGLDREIAPATPAPVLARAFLRGPQELFAPTFEMEEAVHD